MAFLTLTECGAVFAASPEQTVASLDPLLTDRDLGTVVRDTSPQCCCVCRLSSGGSTGAAFFGEGQSCRGGTGCLDEMCSVHLWPPVHF